MLVRSLALVATGAALAAGVAGGLAQAEAGRSAVPRGYHFGSDRLLQSQDFNDVGLELDVERVSLLESTTLGACFGDDTVYDVTHGREIPQIGATWKSLRLKDQHLGETAALGESASKTDTYVGRIEKTFHACQHEPEGHFHLGRARHLDVGSGTATYYVSYDGNGEYDGGAAVLSDGAAFAVMDLSGTSAPPLGVMRKLVTAGLQRLH